MKRFETAKLAMIVFIASEAVFFAFLIAAYIYYSGATVHGPRAGNSLDPSRTLLFTICLLASSGTLWLAERRLAAGSRNAFKGWLGLTVVLGSVFLAGQAFEYSGLISAQGQLLRRRTPRRSGLRLRGHRGFTLSPGRPGRAAGRLATPTTRTRRAAPEVVVSLSMT